MRPVISLAALLALSFLAGCQTVQDNVGTCQKPPMDKGEVPPPAPPTSYMQIWQPGHWDWDGRSYAWRDGLWVKREGQSGTWIVGRWDRPATPGPCVWLPAHWQ